MNDGAKERSRFAAIFAGGTLISRVLGLARDIVLLAWIPAVSMDAFILAFKLPNMLRDMLGEGAGNAAFIPVISEYKETKSASEVRDLIGALLSAMVLLFGVICVLGVLAMPALPCILDTLRPLTGGDPKDAELLRQTVLMMQWTFPYLFFIGLAVFAMAPLFAARRYGTASWSPVLLNVTLIFSCVTLYKVFPDPAWSLVVGVWLGGITQVGVMFYDMRKTCGVWLPNFKLRHPGIKQAFWLLTPVILGQAAGEVNKLVDMFFAYSLEHGTVTALFYANRLIQLPLAIFGMATALAILPDMARAGAKRDDAAIRAMLVEGLRRMTFLVLPSMVGLMVLGQPIVRMLFERGEFGAADTLRTANAMFFYTLGLLAFAAVKVGIQGFYAVQNTRTPVIVASGSMLLNILLNCLLIGPMGYQGLALATTLSYFVNAFFILALLGRRFGALMDAASFRALLCMVFAATLMGGGAYATQFYLGEFFGGNGLIRHAAPTLSAMMLGALVYGGVSKACGLQEMAHVLQMIGRLRRR